MTAPTRVAVVGCGAVAEHYYTPALSDLAGDGRVEVCALVDPQSECLQRLAQHFPRARLLADFAELAGDDAELVIVASPPRYHAPQTIALLDQGRSVLCEKPLATTVTQAREVVAAAVRNGGVAALGLSRRCLPAVAMIDDILARGLLGDVAAFHFEEGARFRWPARDRGYFDRQECQGVLLDLGSHAFDLVARWFRAARIVDYQDDAMGGVEANCRIRVECGPVSGELRLSRDCDLGNRYSIYGTKGWLRWPADYANRLTLGVDNSDHELDAAIFRRRYGRRLASDDFDSSFRRQLSNVLAAMTGAERLITPVVDGLEALQLIDQCYRQRRLLPMRWLVDDRRPRRSAAAMRVAVLGASGFIGKRLVEQFHLSASAQVVPVVRRIAGLVGGARFDLRQRLGDARDEQSMRRAFADCDAVVHTIAGDVATITGSIAPVYRAAQDAGVKRIVYLSSASVHGQAPAPGTDERSALSARQAIDYNNAKVEAEERLLRMRAGGDVEVVILRPGVVFGPRSTWIEGFARACVEGRAWLLEGGQGICNSIYVDNLVEAIYRALISDGADGEAFLVGDAERITWAQFYGPIARFVGSDPDELPAALPAAGETRDRLERLLASPPSLRILSLFPDRWRRAARAALDVLRPPPTAVSDAPVASLEMTLLQGCRYKLPHSKAESVLGYRPPVSFAEGMRRSIDWLEFAGFRGPAAADDHRVANN